MKRIFTTSNTAKTGAIILNRKSPTSPGESSHLFHLIKENWDLDKIYKNKEIKVLFFDSEDKIVRVEEEPMLYEKDPMEIITKAGEENAAYLVIAENAVDKDVYPKPDALSTMDTFKKVGKAHSMPLKDYFIFTGSSYFSYSYNKYKTPSINERHLV